MATIHDIEKLTEAYATERTRLLALKDQLDIIVRRETAVRLPEIKHQLAVCAEIRAALRDAIDESRSLFDKPRSRIMHGIKVGLQKGKGKLEWADPARVIARIKEIYIDEIGVLINTKETPNREALEKLPAGDLKKLGITITETGDAIIIKSVDSEIDKLIEAISALGELDDSASRAA